MLNKFDINGDGIFNSIELFIYSVLFVILYFKLTNWFYNKFNFWFMPNREAYKNNWR